MEVFRVLDHIRTSVWFVPVACVIAGVILSLVTLAVDRGTDFKLIPATFTGVPTSRSRSCPPSPPRW